jgi:type II secretion system protein I
VTARVRRGGGARGFTLLEVLVALAILSIAVVAAIQGFAQGLRLLKVSGDHQQATQLADEKARDVPLPLEAGREEGREGAFHWERVTTRVEAPELALHGPAQWEVFEIDVRVTWDPHREVRLATLRTQPIDAAVQVPGAVSTAGATAPVRPAPLAPPPPVTPPAGATPPPAAPATGTTR